MTSALAALLLLTAPPPASTLPPPVSTLAVQQPGPVPPDPTRDCYCGIPTDPVCRCPTPSDPICRGHCESAPAVTGWRLPRPGEVPTHWRYPDGTVVPLPAPVTVRPVLPVLTLPAAGFDWNSGRNAPVTNCPPASLPGMK